MKKIPMSAFKRTKASTRAQWRQWLRKNHASSPGVWLVYCKKGTGRPSVSYEEAVQEALCFGWIDSKPNSLDEERYMQVFTPRKPKSVWSVSNKKRVAVLIKSRLMTDAGLQKVRAAKKDGSWNTLSAVESLRIPPDLRRALKGHPPAETNFNAFGNSSKKIILFWVQSAKRRETRSKRITETVGLASKNLKANHYRQ